MSTTIIAARIGESANLTCYADGIPTPNITWQRGNGVPFQNGLERIRGNVVRLTNIAANDRGIYRCFAQNNVGNAAEYDATVNVNYPPIVQPARPGGQYGQAPDRQYEIMLECLIAGIIAWWYHNTVDCSEIVSNRHSAAADPRNWHQQVVSLAYILMCISAADVYKP
jgi:leucine-rich repeats and immunoglobulin-like domains protein 2